jgi:hypothetical protein
MLTIRFIPRSRDYQKRSRECAGACIYSNKDEYFTTPDAHISTYMRVLLDFTIYYPHLERKIFTTRH